MDNEELLKMLLEAHRHIGELEERNASLMCQIQTMRMNRIDPVDLQSMMKHVLNGDKGIAPLVKLYRRVSGEGLADSKRFVDKSPLGQLIRANMAE
jgi:hypothetical protein